jgi:predicted NBD/HSP70 family sugar kinase
VYLPGAGILIHGEVYTGEHNFAGEIGNLPLTIDWLNLDYNDATVVTECLKNLLAIYCCIVAPEQFVLYGDFWKGKSASQIETSTSALLGNLFQVNVVLSSEFEKDFETGLISVALDHLKSPLTIERTPVIYER